MWCFKDTTSKSRVAVNGDADADVARNQEQKLSR